MWYATNLQVLDSVHRTDCSIRAENIKGTNTRHQHPKLRNSRIVCAHQAYLATLFVHLWIATTFYLVVLAWSSQTFSSIHALFVEEYFQCGIKTVVAIQCKHNKHNWLSRRRDNERMLMKSATTYFYIGQMHHVTQAISQWQRLKAATFDHQHGRNVHTDKRVLIRRRVELNFDTHAVNLESTFCFSRFAPRRV